MEIGRPECVDSASARDPTSVSTDKETSEGRYDEDGNGDGIDDQNNECSVHQPSVKPSYWDSNSPLRVDEDDQLLPNEGLETECGKVTSRKESGSFIEHTAAGTYNK